MCIMCAIAEALKESVPDGADKVRVETFMEGAFGTLAALGILQAEDVPAALQVVLVRAYGESIFMPPPANQKPL